jgi:hypothetical protein
VTAPIVLAALAVVAVLADRLLLWMERRGWVDYRMTNPGRINPGQVGPAFLAIQGLLEPEKRHAAEEQAALKTSRDDRGEKPPHSLLDGDRERVVMQGDQRS